MEQKLREDFIGGIWYGNATVVFAVQLVPSSANGDVENTQPRLNTDSLRDNTVQQDFKAALDESLLPQNKYETTSERTLKTKIMCKKITPITSWKNLIKLVRRRMQTSD